MAKKHGKGFTLIELLVVVAIIGLLSSIVMTSLNSARAKARDAKAISDFRQLRTALALYFDKYSKFPNEVRVDTNPWTDNFNSMAQQLVTEGFLGSVPVAPTNHNYNYYNYYFINGVGAILVTTLETLAPTAVAPLGSCRPFSTGLSWCDSVNASKDYCICNPY